MPDSLVKLDVVFAPVSEWAAPLQPAGTDRRAQGLRHRCPGRSGWRLAAANPLTVLREQKASRGRNHRPAARSRGPKWLFRPVRQSQAGFTLVELLTVIAIIAVLATLLMTTLSSAKRKAREALCISNLHQIAIALHLYLDDYGKRPPDLQTLAFSKYLGNGRVLTCPADKSGSASALDPASRASSTSAIGTDPASLHVSYQHPFSWSDDQWNRLLLTPSGAGIAACRFHDIRSSSADQAASPGPMEGLILRGNLDGTVVRRQVFATNNAAGNSLVSNLAGTGRSADNNNSGGALPPTTGQNGAAVAVAAPTTTPPSNSPAQPDPPWPLFSDDPSP